MLRKTVLAFCIVALVPLSLAFGQGGGNGKAMTPIGNWDLVYWGDWVQEYKVLWTVNFGGTSMVTAQGSPSEDPIVSTLIWGASTGHGTWKKVGRRTYRHTAFTLVPWLPNEPLPPGVVPGTLKGYVKAVHEFTLVDKNTVEGWCDISIVFGPDPSAPAEPPFPRQFFEGKRLRAE